MAAENSKKWNLAKIKNVYHHQKEHLCFSNPARFQHFRCLHKIEFGGGGGGIRELTLDENEIEQMLKYWKASFLNYVCRSL